MAIGGIGSLIYRGITAQTEGTAPAVTFPISIRF